MLFPFLIIQQCLFSQTLLQKLLRHGNGTVRGYFAVEDRSLQPVQCPAGVPVGEGGDNAHETLLHMYRHASESPLIPQGTAQQLCQVLPIQLLEHEDPAAGQQCGIDLKRRVLCSGPDEGNAALLHIGQEGVLLGLVETMYLIHEHQCAHTVNPALLSLLHDVLDLLDAAGDRAEIHEIGLGAVCDDPGQCGFPHSGRPPENHRRYHIFLQHTAQDHTLSQQLALSHVILKGLRAHSVRQRRQPGNRPLIALHIK